MAFATSYIIHQESHHQIRPCLKTTMVTICHGHDHVMGHEAQRTLVDMQIDSAKRDLELGIRSLRQQNHAELFQEAERVAG